MRRATWLRGRWTNPTVPTTLILGGASLSAALLKFAPLPFIWIGLVWAIVFAAGALGLKRPWPPRLFFVLFHASLLSGAAVLVETYLAFHEPAPIEYSSGYSRRDDILGSSPVPRTQGRSRKLEAGSVLYDVIYTIDGHGLRVSPPVSAAGARQCALFFGGSFTFGEGLKDDETLPFQVGLQSGGSVATYNFGFHGYGPHQMLSALEHGLVSRAVTCQPTVAVYQAMAHHVARAAGKVTFTRHAPRYELGEDGRVVRRGHFDDDDPVPSQLESRLQFHLGKAATVRWLQAREGGLSKEDIRLTLAITDASRTRLRALYPGIQFHVLLWLNWDYDVDVFEELARGFQAMGVPVHRVDLILPGYSVSSPEYVLSRADRHPNSLANRILAGYVLTDVMAFRGN
jgi:hypothetical protein